MGYPQRIRLQRRLHGNYLIPFLLFKVFLSISPTLSVKKLVEREKIHLRLTMLKSPFKRNFKWSYKPQSPVHNANLYLINNMENILVFKSLKGFNSDNSYMCLCSGVLKVIFIEKPQIKIINFQNYKRG